MSDDDEAKVRELIAQYADAPQSTEPSAEEFKKMVRHFLENGPGTREERRQIPSCAIWSSCTKSTKTSSTGGTERAWLTFSIRAVNDG